MVNIERIRIHSINWCLPTILFLNRIWNRRHIRDSESCQLSSWTPKLILRRCTYQESNLPHITPMGMNPTPYLTQPNTISQPQNYQHDNSSLDHVTCPCLGWPFLTFPNASIVTYSSNTCYIAHLKSPLITI